MNKYVRTQSGHAEAKLLRLAGFSRASAFPCARFLKAFTSTFIWSPRSSPNELSPDINCLPMPQTDDDKREQRAAGLFGLKARQRRRVIMWLLAIVVSTYVE